jgi:hypothetical protein
VGQVAGVVSTVVAVVGLILVFVPGLKPDPPAAQKGAAFSELTIDPMVTRGEYLRRLDRGPGDYTREQLRERGVVVGSTSRSRATKARTSRCGGASTTRRTATRSTPRRRRR